MKCTACGENNVPTARFCAFCGTKLPVEAAPSAPSADAPSADAAPLTDGGSSHSSRPTAHPLSDNPYQPFRMSSASRMPIKPENEEKPAPKSESVYDRSESVYNKYEPFSNRIPYGSSAYENMYPEIEPAPETKAKNTSEAEAENEPLGIEPEKDCPVERPFDPSDKPGNSSAPVQPPYRAPILRGESRMPDKAPAQNTESEAEAENVPTPRVRIPAANKRVFVFSDEKESDILPRSKILKNRLYDEEDEDEEDYIDEYDGIREFDDYNEFDDDEDDYEDDEEDEEPTAGRIFVRVFSVLTVLLLIAGLVAFAYGTTVGRRLRASMGLSSEASDYILLADWQLAQHTYADASASYYNAFKLDPDNYELAMTVGAGFENAQDDKRAESLYVYLIENNPQKDAAYDRLMALLNQQGRTADYEVILKYRSAQQPGYQPPVSQVSQILQTPTASHASGAYAASLTLTLNAGGAEIRYTLDGTVPTAQSRLYTGAIVLGRGSYTIRAVAVVNGIISAEWVGEFFIS